MRVFSRIAAPPRRTLAEAVLSKSSDSVPTLHVPSAVRRTVEFDLPMGRVRLGEEESARAVVVPAAALLAMARVAGSVAAAELGHAIGGRLGRRVAARLAGAEGVRGSAVERVASELAHELSLVGFGLLSLERWGRALVVAIDDAPASTPAAPEDDVLLASIVESMFAAASGRELLRAHPLARDGARMRVLLANVAAIERVVAWLAEGSGWGDAIMRLHAGRMEAS
jgi:hypothetical protein